MIYQEQSILETQHCHQVLMYVDPLVKENKPCTQCLRSVLYQNTMIPACVSE